jgi:hypothetical protein
MRGRQHWCSRAPTGGNIFFGLCPPMTLIPLIVLATVATIIARPVDHHQRVLDDAASDPARLVAEASDQADLFGKLRADLCRRRQLAPDDRDGGLTIGFGRSDNLAAAYGIAVSLIMLMTWAQCSSRRARSDKEACLRLEQQRSSFKSSTALSSWRIEQDRGRRLCTLSPPLPSTA